MIWIEIQLIKPSDQTKPSCSLYSYGWHASNSIICNRKKKSQSYVIWNILFKGQTRFLQVPIKTGFQLLHISFCRIIITCLEKQAIVIPFKLENVLRNGREVDGTNTNTNKQLNGTTIWLSRPVWLSNDEEILAIYYTCADHGVRLIVAIDFNRSIWETRYNP